MKAATEDWRLLLAVTQLLIGLIEQQDEFILINRWTTLISIKWLLIMDDINFQTEEESLSVSEKHILIFHRHLFGHSHR